MGGPGSGRFPRKPEGTHLGKRSPNKANRDGGISNLKPIPKPGNTLAGIQDTSEYGTPQPNPSGAWNNIVTAWWRSLGKAQLAMIAQPADWMYAWVAADLLQYMYDTSGFQAGLMQNWVAMADRLHAPHFDRVDLPDGAAEPVDEDRERAQSAVSDIKSRFKVV
jgi:hypothetical protein